MEIKFSVQGTGACPICIYKSNCRIRRNAGAFLEKEVKEEHDEVMELVIYRCPEFVECTPQDDCGPGL